MRLSLEIADTVLAIDSPHSRWRFLSPQPYQGFIADSARTPHLAVEVRRSAPPAELEAIVPRPAPLACQAVEDHLRFQFFLPPARLARWLEVPSEPSLWCRPLPLVLHLNREVYGEEHFYPLDYPLDEMFLGLYWASRKVFVAHALGVMRQGRGYLFLGHSGDGKSTQARALAGDPANVILSDDRIAVEERNGRFFLHGTPWHGEAQFACNCRAPLDKIFILARSGDWQVSPLAPVQAVAQIVSRFFLVNFHRPTVERGLDFAAALAAAHPVARLEVPPGGSVRRALD